MIVVATLVTLAASAHGIFIPVETEEVPIARLIANAEKKVGKNAEAALAKDPAKADDVALLARLHALAWAKNADKVAVEKRGGDLWLGYTPPIVDYRNAHTPGDRKPAVAKHLDQAIRLYRLALAKLPDRVGIALGLAWCLAQKPDEASKNKARALLRALIAKAWPEEEARVSWGLGNYGVTYEAARYLVPLLDATADRAELDELERRSNLIAKKPRPITPIVVPLVADATLEDVVDPDARVRFDLDGSGLDRRWGWIRENAAWLVWDADGDGDVRSGLDLFGSVTFWMFWDDGYAALGALDDDRDGLVAGPELAGLALWQDDGDGVAEPGEVTPVADRGIVALRTDAALRADGVSWVDEGVLFADGTSRPTWDWITTAR